MKRLVGAMMVVAVALMPTMASAEHNGGGCGFDGIPTELWRGGAYVSQDTTHDCGIYALSVGAGPGAIRVEIGAISLAGGTVAQIGGDAFENTLSGPPLAGRTVTLWWDVNGNGVYGDGNDALVGTKVTSKTGVFQFLPFVVNPGDPALGINLEVGTVSRYTTVVTGGIWNLP